MLVHQVGNATVVSYCAICNLPLGSLLLENSCAVRAVY